MKLFSEFVLEKHPELTVEGWKNWAIGSALGAAAALGVGGVASKMAQKNMPSSGFDYNKAVQEFIQKNANEPKYKSALGKRMLRSDAEIQAIKSAARAQGLDDANIKGTVNVKMNKVSFDR